MISLPSLLGALTALLQAHSLCKRICGMFGVLRVRTSGIGYGALNIR